MNKDEVKNLAAALAVLLAPTAAKFGLSAGELTQIGVGFIPLAIMVYMHWNMRKVDESSETDAGDGA